MDGLLCGIKGMRKSGYFILQSASALFRNNFHLKVFRMLYLHATPDSWCYISTVPDMSNRWSPRYSLCTFSRMPDQWRECHARNEVIKEFFNLFASNAPFSNSWKHGVEKGCTGDEWARVKLRRSFKMFKEYFPTKYNIRNVQR